jgi:hypothetical protein
LTSEKKILSRESCHFSLLAKLSCLFCTESSSIISLFIFFAMDLFVHHGS